MNKSKRLLSFAAALSIAAVLSGCASYNASPLKSLDSDTIITHIPPAEINDHVIVRARAFTKDDCKKYLDRNVIAEGYQPIQLYIQNNSERNFIFSLNRITLPLARSEEVANKVHTNTVGRIVGYGAAAVFTCGLFAIPAIVDGVKSANANEALDHDFSMKVATDQVIPGHSYFNKLIFVSRSEYQSLFSITLIDQESRKPKTIEVSVLN